MEPHRRPVKAPRLTGELEQTEGDGVGEADLGQVTRGGPRERRVSVLERPAEAHVGGALGGHGERMFAWPAGGMRGRAQLLSGTRTGRQYTGVLTRSGVLTVMMPAAVAGQMPLPRRPG